MIENYDFGFNNELFIEEYKLIYENEFKEENNDTDYQTNTNSELRA